MHTKSRLIERWSSYLSVCELIGPPGYDLLPEPLSRRPLVEEKGQRGLSGQIFLPQSFIGLVHSNLKLFSFSTTV